jgi:hypothetical protein
MFVGVQDLTGQKAQSMSQSGMIISGPARSIVSQNSLTMVDMRALDVQKINFFATSSPGANTHWLRQIRIAMHPDDDEVRKRSVSSSSRFSQSVTTTIVTYHRCDRISCLGCKSAKLQALCYASKQCATVKCVGTIVNQNRPLCNIGLVMASYMESSTLMMMGAWSIFTETYGKILDAALIGPDTSLQACVHLMPLTMLLGFLPLS